MLVLGAAGLPAEPRLVDDGHFIPGLFKSPEKSRLLQVDLAADTAADDAAALAEARTRRAGGSL